jgi:hypothetical protein
MLDCVFDGGRLSETPEAKQGSTVVDLSKRGLFTVIRDGRYENKMIYLDEPLCMSHVPSLCC